MNSIQESKLNMYDAVIAHCNANSTIITTIPALVTALAGFSAKVTALHTAAQNEASVISGVAGDKADLKETLTDAALNIAGAVFAFASGAGNNELKEKVNFSRTDLLRLKDELLTAATQDIHTQANANVASLATYGITPAILTDFQTLITNYANKVPAPRNAASLRSSYGDQIKQLFVDCDEILKEQMDKLVLQVKASEPIFYNAYKSNRVILDPGSSVTKLEGRVIESGTDLGLGGVTVQVVGQPYSTTSASNGQYSLNITVPGTYTIQFSKAGFQPNQLPDVQIVLGSTTTLLDVEMTAA